MTISAHPELPPFEYIRPESFKEASRFLEDHYGEARPLAGGTDIFVRMRDGIWRDRYLVDIKHLNNGKRLHFNLRDGLELGAAVNMNQVIASGEIQAHIPVLAQACRTVASYQLRTRATVVGNLCNASPAGDTIGACLVLGGILTVHGVDGERKILLKDFFMGPGKTCLQSGDIVTSLKIPSQPNGAVGVYLKLGRNTWGDLSIVGVTAYGYPDPTLPSGYRFKVALASVAPLPLSLQDVEDFLGEHPITEEALAHAAQLAQAASSPIDDVRGSARYRAVMVRKLTLKALRQVWERLSSANI